MSVDSFLPYVCILFGCGHLVFGAWILRLCAKSKSWLKTEGVITESSIQSEWASEGGGSFIYVVRPKVVYEYRVGERQYHSSHLTVVEINTASAKNARTKAGKYSPGQLVDVYYNPRKPEFAVLTVGDPTGGVFPLCVMALGIALVIAGGIWLRFELI